MVKKGFLWSCQDTQWSDKGTKWSSRVPAGHGMGGQTRVFDGQDRAPGDQDGYTYQLLLIVFILLQTM